MSASINKGITEITFTVSLNPSCQDMNLPDSIKKLYVIRKNNANAYTGGRICNNVLSLFSATSDIETITIDYGVVKPVNAIDTFRSSDNFTTLKTIHFNVDTSECTGWDRFLYHTYPNTLHGVVIDGTPIDFVKMTRWMNTLNFCGLKEIRFIPNRISVSDVTIANIYTEEYSDETWVSLVNALKSGQNGTFNIGETAITRIMSIAGVNSSGLFILDPSGTMSLYDFATTIKGWAVA